MKRAIISLIISLVILVCISCVSSKRIHLVNLTTKELSSETEVILTMTKPVQYSFSKLENPPTIIIKFPESKVFSSQENFLNINRGPIKTIKNEVHKPQGSRRGLLRLVKVELTQDLPYEILNSGSSIILRIKNPQSSDHTGGDKTETQPQTGEILPTESGYLIGPGDVLSIELWKQPDVTREVIVNYKGEIRLPPLRKISVLGLTVPQIEEMLMETLSKYFLEPIVFVAVKEYNSQRIIALGETNSGMYTLKRATTLIEFIGQIGGAKENADISNIKLIRKDGSVLSYDFNELINDPQKSNQALLSGGDTVYIPPIEMKKVCVLGEVNGPKSLEIDGKLTVAEAIAEAGGYTHDAVTKSVIVIRGELGSQRAIRVDLGRVLKKADIGQNIELKPGDIVYVPKSFIADVERFLRDVALPMTWYFWIAK